VVLLAPRKVPNALSGTPAIGGRGMEVMCKYYDWFTRLQ